MPAKTGVKTLKMQRLYRRVRGQARSYNGIPSESRGRFNNANRVGVGMPAHRKTCRSALAREDGREDATTAAAVPTGSRASALLQRLSAHSMNAYRPR